MTQQTLFTLPAVAQGETGAVEKHPPSVQAAPAKVLVSGVANLDSGETRKWKGISKSFVHRPEALAKVRRAARRASILHGDITAEDVRLFALEDGVSEWDFRYLIGGIFAADDWEKVRQVKATHPEAHGRPIWVWRRKRQ